MIIEGIKKIKVLKVTKRKKKFFCNTIHTWKINCIDFTKDIICGISEFFYKIRWLRGWNHLYLFITTIFNHLEHLEHLEHLDNKKRKHIKNLQNKWITKL
jgi:hypothetical protein